MIGLLEPLALAALASLLLPLVIHLVRRAERRPLPFAAMRFLSERRHPRREWQLRQWPLLALRLLLLAVVSAFLAVPVWRGRGGMHDTSGAQTTAPRRVIFAGASRLRQLDAELPRDALLAVVVAEELDGLDAERLHLRHTVRWEIVPGPSPAASFSPVVDPSALSIAVRVDAAGNGELPVAKALMSAWKTAGRSASIDTASLSVPVPQGTDWLLWLGGRLSAQAGDWVSRWGRVLLSRDPAARGAVVLADADGRVMFRERGRGRGRIVSTPATLSIDALPGLREAATAERLQSLLSAPLTAPDRAHAADVMPSSLDSAAVGVPLGEYAALLAALLFFAERFWATRSP